VSMNGGMPRQKRPSQFAEFVGKLMAMVLLFILLLIAAVAVGYVSAFVVWGFRRGMDLLT
jgi:hypothetical protein